MPHAEQLTVDDGTASAAVVALMHSHVAIVNTRIVGLPEDVRVMRTVNIKHFIAISSSAPNPDSSWMATG